MNDRKLRSAMGFAMKAGKCRAGDFTCEKLIAAGRVKLAMIDAAASDNTKNRYSDVCFRRNIRLIEIENMGKPIGKSDCMVAVVTDDGFADMIRSAYDAEN